MVWSRLMRRRGKRDPLNRRNRLRFEPLEDRTMLDVSVVAGVLTITGTDAADVLRIDRSSSGPDLDVILNGDLTVIPLTGLTSYSVNLANGENHVTVADDVTLPGVITGGIHNDALTGGGGDETIDGGGGNDILDGGLGTNVLIGGLGADIWVVMGTEDGDTISIDIETNEATVETSTLVRFDTFQNLETQDLLFVSAGDGDDFIEVRGFVRAILVGGADDDTVHGGQSDDYIDGGDGDDELFGRDGDDRLFGDRGDDLLDGGPGGDVLVGSAGQDELRPGTGTNEVLIGGLAPAVTKPKKQKRSSPPASTTVSFETTVTVGGSVAGFTGSGTAHVAVQATLDANGLTGTFTAHGSGSGTGDGCTATFDFTANGTVSGNFAKLSVDANYAGNGSAICDGEQFNASLSGQWSGTFSLISGIGSQTLKPAKGAVGIASKGASQIDTLTVTSGQELGTKTAKSIEQPATVALRTLLRGKFSQIQKVEIFADRDVRGKAGTKSGHATGSAADVFLDANDPEERAIGDRIFNALVQTDSNGVSCGAKIGLAHVIWNRQIWNPSRAKDGVRVYPTESVPNGDPHVDHLHVEFSKKGASNTNLSCLDAALL